MPPKILHVDDFDEFLDEFREIFSPWLDVTSADSARAALELLEGRDFDAVVVDYDMPEMDGIEFTRLVKERWRGLPVLFCTARGSEEVAREAFKAGASDYFSKDFSLLVDREKMVNAIRQAMERRAIEDELQRERHILESLIEHNPYSIQVWSREGYNLRYNAASVELFRATPPSDVNCFTDPNFVGTAYGECFARVRQGETVRFPTIPYDPSAFSPDAPSHTLYTTGVVFPLLDENGEMERMVVMHEDATPRVLAEEALKQANEQLEARVTARTAELAAANEALQREIEERERLQQELVRRNRELEAFSSRVSHDLRNELLVLRRTLEGVADTPEMRARTEGLLTRHDRLLTFVGQLLELARMGKVISQRVPVLVGPLATELFERLRPHGVAARLEITPDCPPVPGDPVGLEQILANLLNNSFSYADAEKSELQVELQVTDQGDEVELRYRDNGVGIAVENLDRIFDTSFTTDREHHFGMGLSFVRKIVEAHKGTVRAMSLGRGQGAEFVLRLPKGRHRRATLPCRPA